MFRGPSVYIGGDRLAICWAPDPSPPSRVGNQRAYTQVPMAESTAGERARKQRRGSSTTARASAATIAKFFDVQLPALTEYLTPLASAALAATSKERLQALAKRPVMAALARAVPILHSPPVLQRIADARLQGPEVLAILLADERGTRWRSRMFDYECIVECTLLNGRRFVERHAMFKKYFEGADETTLYLDLPVQVRNVNVLESAKLEAGWDPDLDYVNRYEDPDLDFREYEDRYEFSQRAKVVGNAKVTIVRDDGRFLPLFQGKISMIPDLENDWGVDEGFPYYMKNPFEVARWAQLTNTEEALAQTHYVETLHSNATLATKSVRLPSGAYAYQAQQLQLKFEWRDYNPARHSRPFQFPYKKLNNDHALLRLLDGHGDWR